MIKKLCNSSIEGIDGLDIVVKHCLDPLMCIFASGSRIKSAKETTKFVNENICMNKDVEQKVIHLQEYINTAIQIMTIIQLILWLLFKICYESITKDYTQRNILWHSLSYYASSLAK